MIDIRIPQYNNVANKLGKLKLKSEPYKVGLLC